jgi:hypothetical protein
MAFAMRMDETQPGLFINGKPSIGVPRVWVDSWPLHASCSCELDRDRSFIPSCVLFVVSFSIPPPQPLQRNSGLNTQLPFLGYS